MDNKRKPLVVITGASSGIGMATAKLFSQAGYALLLLARRREKMEALNLPDCRCEQVDVANGAAFKAAICEAEKQFGPTECLINNAGVMLSDYACKQNPEEWKQMIHVNLMGVLNGIHAVLHHMVERKTGTVFNIGSIAGAKTIPDHAVYCATKFAVHALSETIREEVCGSRVRIITIAPGLVETELLNHTSSDRMKAAYQDWNELFEGGISAETIAECMLFAFRQPQQVCIRQMVVAPTVQSI